MNNGLEGVIAAETVLSHADGERGAVWVRGHTIEKLAAAYGYEGAVAVMWEGFAGHGLTRAGMRESLSAARAAAFARRGGQLKGTSQTSSTTVPRTPIWTHRTQCAWPERARSGWLWSG